MFNIRSMIEAYKDIDKIVESISKSKGYFSSCNIDDLCLKLQESNEIKTSLDFGEIPQSCRIVAMYGSAIAKIEIYGEQNGEEYEALKRLNEITKPILISNGKIDYRLIYPKLLGYIEHHKVSCILQSKLDLPKTSRASIIRDDLSEILEELGYSDLQWGYNLFLNRKEKSVYIVDFGMSQFGFLDNIISNMSV